MPTYPSAQLPNPSSRFTGDKESGVVTTKFASGHVRNRNAFNDLRRNAKLVFEFSQREFDLFQGWWNYTLDNGALDFTIDLFLDADNEQTYEVTPVAEYKWNHFGVGYYKVSLQVILLEQKYVSAEIVELFQTYGDSFEDMLVAGDPLDEFTNQTLPPNFQLLTS